MSSKKPSEQEGTKETKISICTHLILLALYFVSGSENTPLAARTEIFWFLA